MSRHYYTSENSILCKQKHKNNICAVSRFSYVFGAEGNCRNCEKILLRNVANNKNKCNSLVDLGYKTDCSWRHGSDCFCIDDCNFKQKINNK